MKQPLAPIRLNYPDGKFMAEVTPKLVRGQLALFRNLKIGLWNITHIPTGGRVWLGGPLPVARRIIKRLALLDWDFTDPKSEKLAVIAPVRKQILEEETNR